MKYRMCDCGMCGLRKNEMRSNQILNKKGKR